jgi:serine/threonine protein phosphatase PrpC
MKSIQSKPGGRAENQDFYDSALTHFGELVVVCDGMGGHNGGRHAAEIAVEIIIEEVSKSDDSNPVKALHGAISKANTAIWDESHSNINLKGMGTTVVALLISPKKAISCHVGDSRIYQLRNGKILHRTFDHSHVFELVRAGLITEEQARVSKKSNIITRGLGINSTDDIEITDNLSYQTGDRFLLCTDGIWGAVPENELVEMASQNKNLELVLNQLVEKIDAIGFANGGRHDNLTAALIEIESNSNFQGKKPTSKKKKRKIFFFLILAAVAVLLALSFFFLKKENHTKQHLIKTKITKVQTDKNLKQSEILIANLQNAEA